ncbi:MAG: hypothetical protein AAF489_07625 [Bacteroidota bacterium]
MKIIRILLFLVFVQTPLLSFSQETVMVPVELPGDHPGTIRTYTNNYSNSNIDGYNLYVPKSCGDKNSKCPVLVFLQGGKGVGGSVQKLMKWGLPKKILESTALKTDLDKFMRDTFIVVMPHIEDGQFFEGETAMRQILDEVIKNETADPNRIYLTGLSRGGYGTWGLASRMSDVFAAAAPICGSGFGVTAYENLADLPLWVSHNTGDGVVNYRGSSRAVEKLEAVSDAKFHHSSSIASAKYNSNKNIFTSTRSDSHDAWTEMYGEVNFYKWLLRFKK